MRYAYYPGCSVESTSVAYATSVRHVADALGLELHEIDDWNCCGATEYFALDRLVALSVVARNLALVKEEFRQLVAVCSACYLNLKKTDKVLQEHPELRDRVNQALEAGGLSYTPGRFKVRHLLDVLHADFGEEKIRKRVRQPLTWLRVAPYYGCQIVRPLDDGFDNPEYPKKMDELLRWLGVTVVDYPVKAHCCGGHMTQISEEQAFELIRRLLQGAADFDADVIACLCPMCQLNLDIYQGHVNARFGTRFRLPVLFFTQLMGLAFGFSAESLGLGWEIIPGEPIPKLKLTKATAPAPAEDQLAQDRPELELKTAARKRDSKELPMPRMD